MAMVLNRHSLNNVKVLVTIIIAIIIATTTTIIIAIQAIIIMERATTTTTIIIIVMIKIIKSKFISMPLADLILLFHFLIEKQKDLPALD